MQQHSKAQMSIAFAWEQPKLIPEDGHSANVCVNTTALTRLYRVLCLFDWQPRKKHICFHEPLRQRHFRHRKPLFFWKQLHCHIAAAVIMRALLGFK